MRRYKLVLLGLISGVGLSIVGLIFTSAGPAQITKSNGAGSAKAIGGFFFKKTGSGACEVPPTWGGVIPVEDRFVPTFVDDNGEALGYCDRQTGLVWETAPEFVEGAGKTWNQARLHCINRVVGGNGQKGWRLPAVPELASLMVTNSALCTGGGPCLPDGHPFQNVQSAPYWSVSGTPGDIVQAWAVLFNVTNVDPFSKTSMLQAWCVRGAMSADEY